MLQAFLAHLFFEQREGPVLTGRRFKLQTPTLAIDGVDGKRQSSYVPAGAIIKVVSGPTSDGDRMVDVLWNGKVVTMFAIDVNVRGTEVLDESAEA
jgi:hypothetical protein